MADEPTVLTATWKPSRSTKNQNGSIQIFVAKQAHGGGGGRRFEFIPLGHFGNRVGLNQQLNVAWSLPDSALENKKADEYSATGSSMEKELSIGLFRLGTPNNTNSVVTKRLSRGKTSGRIDFFAPKMPGPHVFRIFDASSKDDSIETLCTSPTVTVVAVDEEINTVYTRIKDAFRDDKTGLAMNMIQVMAENCSYSDTGRVNRPAHAAALHGICANLLKAIVKAIADLDTLSVSLVEAEEEARAARETAVESGAEGDKAGGAGKATAMEEATLGSASAGAATVGASAATAPVKDNKLKDLHQQLYHTTRFHTEGADALSAVQGNHLLMALLRSLEEHDPQAPRVLQEMARMTASYSTLLQRFFISPEAVERAHRNECSFYPTRYIPTSQYRYVSIPHMELLQTEIINHFRSTAQTAEMAALKETVRGKIEDLLRAEFVIDHSTSLGIFGSSRNNFGSNTADLDMCLQFMNPAAAALAVEQDGGKGALITKIGDCLGEHGYHIVQIRDTARIPIVHFTDTESKIECDIAFYNPLALRNTQLLRLYSDLDPRVRPLGFLIKRWAKARDINNPGEGTLSSYGWVLLLIHFLQSRRPAVLPNLQQIGKASSQPQSNEEAEAFRQQQRQFTVPHPIDSTPCDTYFFAPANQMQMTQLQNQCRSAQQPMVVLLLEFFRYYAWEFDYRHHVLSVNTPRMRPAIGPNGVPLPEPAPRVEKIHHMEAYCWKMNDRLCVEDPFEPWYDIAHVVRPNKMTTMRMEFAVSVGIIYTVLLLCVCPYVCQLLSSHALSLYVYLSTLYSYLIFYIESLHNLAPCTVRGWTGSGRCVG